MRRLLALLVFTFACLAARAEKSPYPAPTGYVDDFAHVLSPEAAIALELQAIELHDKTHAQVFLVTIQSLQGADIKQFANDLFHTWKIGEKGTDRGVLILFVIADHKWRFEIGSGLEGILNDAKVGDLGRTLVPSLRAADYDSAAQQAFSGVAGVIAADANVTLATPPPLSQADSQPAPAPTAPVAPDHSGAILLLVFVAIGFGAILLIAVLLKVRGSGYSGSTPSGSSGSSFGSSSSSSSSSSDSSSFSGGDGGDSSGGGADGSW